MEEHAPKPPKFPTLEEILGLEVQEAPKKPAGFLQELLGGSPLPLYQDAQEYPEKYRPEDIEFLEKVVARGPRDGQWELSEDERKRLDQMVFTFATAKRIEPPPVRRPPPKPRPAKKDPAPDAMSPYWWLK